MNSYIANISPKKVAGSGIGHMGNDRQITIITGSLQDAFSIAKTKCAGGEYVTGVYVNAEDVVIDYSQIQQGQQI